MISFVRKLECPDTKTTIHLRKNDLKFRLYNHCIYTNIKKLNNYPCLKTKSLKHQQLAQTAATKMVKVHDKFVTLKSYILTSNKPESGLRFLKRPPQQEECSYS